MKQLVFRVGGTLILLGSLLLGWQWMRYQEFLETPLTLPEEGLALSIAPGASLSAVASKLEAQGILSSATYLRLLVRMDPQYAATIKLGDYHIKPGTTPPQLLTQLIEGKVVQHSLTLIEGWNFREMMAVINADPNLKHTLQGLTADQIMEQIGYPGEHPEGRFFPDTYLFPRGLSDVEFLKRAYGAMEQHLAREWEGRAEGLPLNDPYEALILASIVEKETGNPSERADIAGVFVRRLQKGMLLQTDPTIIYGLGEAFDGDIRTADLRRDGPYNSYTRKGLPPTPIAMPGLDALHAALHPAGGDALYFVARGNGTTKFSATLAEHEAAVDCYQRKRCAGYRE